MITWDQLESTSDSSIEFAHSVFSLHGVVSLTDALAPQVVLEAKQKGQCIMAELVKVRNRRKTLGLLGDGVFQEICCRDGDRFDVQLQEEEPFVTLGKQGAWCEVVRRVLGNDMRLLRSGLIVANASKTGSGSDQDWHVDGGHLFDDGPHLSCHCLTVIVPLLDCTEENGATELSLGTHVDQDEYPNGQVTAECVAGNVYLFDCRILHRGTANCTSEDRIDAYFTYAKPWFADPVYYSCENSNTSIMDFSEPIPQAGPEYTSHVAAVYLAGPVSQTGPGQASDCAAVPLDVACATKDASCVTSMSFLVDSFIASPELMLPSLRTSLTLPANCTALDGTQGLKVLTILCQLLMSAHTSTVREAAAEAIKMLAAADDSMCDLVRKVGGLRLLVSLVGDAVASPTARGAAARTLQGLASNSENEDAIREAGAFPPLVALLSNNTVPAGVREAAAHALQSLATSTDNEDAIREAGGMLPLMELVADVSAEVALRERAVKALQNLSTNQANQDQIHAGGGLLSLQALAANDQVPKSLRLASENTLRNLDSSCKSGIPQPCSSLPENWDMSVEFTQRLIVEASFAPLQHTIRREILLGRPTHGVEIRSIDCARHPCHGQRGLFATKTIPKGARIVQYTGVLARRISGDVCSDYLFALRGTDLDIDAQHAGNESRYINDCQGTSFTRNVQFKEEWVASVGSTAAQGASQCVLLDELVVWVEALRTIKSGEELLLSYGSQFFDSVERGSSDDCDSN